MIAGPIPATIPDVHIDVLNLKPGAAVSNKNPFGNPGCGERRSRSPVECRFPREVEVTCQTLLMEPFGRRTSTIIPWTHYEQTSRPQHSVTLAIMLALFVVALQVTDLTSELG